MPQTINPMMMRSIFENYFQLYGGDPKKVNPALRQTLDYFKTAPSNQDTYNKNMSPLKGLLSAQASRGLPEIDKMRQTASVKIKNASERNVRAVRENVDPMLLKTMGTSAFNKIFQGEEEAIGDMEMGFNQLQLQAKDSAISKLLGIAEGEAQAFNQDRNFQFDVQRQADQTRLQQYQIDKEDDFDWGQAIGGLLGGLGRIF